MMKLPSNRYTFFAVLWFFAGVYFLLLRDSGGAPPFPHFDKVAHFALFFAQTWLLARAFVAGGLPIPHRILFSLALLFAVGSETAQAVWTTTREGSLADVAADLLGTVAALWLAGKVQKAKLMHRSR